MTESTSAPDRLDALFAKLLTPDESVVEITRRLLAGGVAAPREIEAALIEQQTKGFLLAIEKLIEIAETRAPFQTPPDATRTT